MAIAPRTVQWLKRAVMAVVALAALALAAWGYGGTEFIQNIASQWALCR